MKFAIFRSVKDAKSGVVCDGAKFYDIADHPNTLSIVKQIRAIIDGNLNLDLNLNGDNNKHLNNSTPEGVLSDKEVKKKINALKTQLPVICWQSDFEGGVRSDETAIPSGLYMIDIDGCGKEMMQEIINRAHRKSEECGIVYIGETPKYGVRVVACCRPELKDIAECQQYLFDALEVPEEFRDTCCVDWARCSFMMPTPLIHYINGQIFEPDFTCHTYENLVPKGIKAKIVKAVKDVTDGGTGKAPNQTKMAMDTGQTEYKGLSLKDIAREWYNQCDKGEPTEGNRNTKIFKMVTRLRYICDFNEAVVLRNVDGYGLDDAELKSVVHNAVCFPRSLDAPNDIAEVIEKMLRTKGVGGNVSDDEEYIDINDTTKVPALPPIFKEWYDSAPDDFKRASVIVQLPILGALGSKLRARYWDKKIQSPSFQVSLEAPQASGKSFMRSIINYDLAMMKEHDAAEREKELEYNDKVAKIKLLNTKVTKKDQGEVLGDKPKPLIRYCPATMSITQLLRRTHNAKGLHLFAMAEEIDTVYKAFKRGFSSFSDALRTAFDNGEYGQDYASENSFSGVVELYYNVLYSGTPKAMRRFYPDVEDGLVSRVFFCTLPDQWGKPMPVWKDFTPEQENRVQLALTRLNEITLQGEEVQPDHVMQMDWLADEMQKWCVAQQALSLQTEDRTRDIFCRRAGVVGFRAGMLAWFLWGEKPQRRKSVVAFSKWIANLMLKQHLTRFKIEEDEKSTVPYAKLYKELPAEFTREQMVGKMKELGMTQRLRSIIYRWMSADMISPLEKDPHGSGNRSWRKEAK